jgi:DNA-binding XRE family transcriptional regulator
MFKGAIMIPDPDRVKRVHSGSINRLLKDVAQAKRQTDSVQRSRTLFLSDLMLIRLQQGMTQKQLSRRSGLQQSAIARIEKGETSPTLDTLIKLARALNKELVLE